MNNKTEQHGIYQQIPRNCLLLIMLAQATVVIPHLQHTSIWIIGLGLGCAWWRWMTFKEKLPFPAWWLKGILAIVTGSVIAFSLGLQHSLELWTSFLIVAYALKLLETKNRRDAYAVIFLSYFVIATAFIYDQSIFIAIYQLGAITLVTAAMVGMNQQTSREQIVTPIKTASKLILQSLPLMLALFLIFPRLSPFWSVPIAKSSYTGLDQEMTPGDVASLAQSDEIVFRAVFDNEIPSNAELYWRGLVYSNFVAGTWSSGAIPRLRDRSINVIDWNNDNQRAYFVPNLSGLDTINYQILQEPSGKIWQFGLDLAIPKPRDNGLTWDFRVVSKDSISSLIRYNISSYPDAVLDAELPPWLRQRETRLPRRDNQRVAAFAQELHAASSSDQEFIDKLLQRIRNENFYYTLSPPTLPSFNSIDEFWFETRAGFCAHYAGAITFMLRSVGIPARVVAGYQGGDINPVTGHVVVRQYHAHAWVEAWLPDVGWQRIDPTAVIAPERIEQGLDAALSDQDLNSLSTFTNARLNGLTLTAKMLYFMESLEHRWNMFVVGYDTDRQSSVLAKILGNITTAKIALVLFIGAGISIAVVTLSLLLHSRRNPQHPALKMLNHFSRKIKAKELQRQRDESPMQFIARIGKVKKVPETAYKPLIKKLQEIFYSSERPCSKPELEELQQLLLKMQQSLHTSNH